MKISTGLQTYLANTGSLRSAMASCFVKVYSGAVPADADAALGSAVLLDSFSAGAGGASGTGGTWDATLVNGALVKTASETWKDASTGPVASGTASFIRAVLAADDGTASTTQIRVQYTVGVSAADAILANTTFTANGAQRTITGAQLVISKG